MPFFGDAFFDVGGITSRLFFFNQSLIHIFNQFRATITVKPVYNSYPWDHAEWLLTAYRGW